MNQAGDPVELTHTRQGSERKRVGDKSNSFSVRWPLEAHNTALAVGRPNRETVYKQIQRSMHFKRGLADSGLVHRTVCSGPLTLSPEDSARSTAPLSAMACIRRETIQSNSSMALRSTFSATSHEELMLFSERSSMHLSFPFLMNAEPSNRYPVRPQDVRQLIVGVRSAQPSLLITLFQSLAPKLSVGLFRAGRSNLSPQCWSQEFGPFVQFLFREFSWLERRPRTPPVTGAEPTRLKPCLRSSRKMDIGPVHRSGNAIQ